MQNVETNFLRKRQNLVTHSVSVVVCETPRVTRVRYPQLASGDEMRKLVGLIVSLSSQHRVRFRSNQQQFSSVQFSSVQFSSVQFSSRWYLCAREGPHALHPVSHEFPQHCPCSVLSKLKGVIYLTLCVL